MKAATVTPLRPAPTHRNAALPDFVERRVLRYYRDRVQNTWAGGNIMRGRIPGPESLRLTSNDYLALAQHPDIQTAMRDSIEREGNGVLMSGVFLHGDCPQLALERRIATYMKAEAGVLCQSGYNANVGLIQVIADQHTPVYIDMMAHTSLWEGIRSAGATAVAFFHNDVDHLARQVQRHGPGVVVIDTVYSTTGSLAPIQDILEVCELNGCVLVADESHSLGTHGPRGAGLAVAEGIHDRVHFRTASLAKAFAGRAGYITCSKEFTEYFKFEANPAIFSSTLLPHEVSGLDATLSIIQRDNWRRERLADVSAYVRASLSEQGYNLNESQTQIVSLEAGAEQQTIVLRDALESRGVFGSAFIAPATPKNRSLIRFSLNAGLTDLDVEHLVQVCAVVRDEVGMCDWPSTRRMARRRTAAIPTHTSAHQEAIGNAPLAASL